MNRVKRVLLDTNALLLPFSEKVDVFSEVSKLLEGKWIPLLLLESLEEILDKIARGKPSERRAFRSALRFIDRCVLVKGEPWPPSVDAKILAYAASNRCIVLTNDRELRRKLRRMGVPCMYYRESRRGLESDTP